MAKPASKLHIKAICNLYVITYKMHINYISSVWRPVGKLSGTCWKLFGEPVISKEKTQPEEPNGGKHSTVSFLFCSVWGEGAWPFGPSPGAGRLRNNETIVRLGRFQSHVYAVLFRDSKQNQIHQPPARPPLMPSVASRPPPAPEPLRGFPPDPRP